MSVFARIVEEVCDFVFPARETARLTRRINISELRALYRPQTIQIEDISIVSLFSYRIPEIQALILEAKFHKNAHAYALLGLMVARYVGTYRTATYIKVCPKIALVPIPLGAARRAARGYNQVEEVAKIAHLALLRKYPSISVVVLPDMLTRTRDTTPQMTLGRAERLENMCNAFVATTNHDEFLDSSTVYVLLDDVLTTGATLLAAHQALRAAGAEFITPLSLAH